LTNPGLAEGVPGELNRWAVEDKGQPSSLLPDQMSSIPENENNADTKTCEDDMTDRPTSRDVDRGNLQVRGG
jgi:hypothetical protein